MLTKRPYNARLCSPKKPICHCINGPIVGPTYGPLFLENDTMKAIQCETTKNWFIVGFSGYKYWGHSARAAELLAQSYFYK